MDEDRFQQELKKTKSNKRKKTFFILFGLALIISIVVLKEIKTELSKSENNNFNYRQLDSTQIKYKIDSLTREMESSIKKILKL